MRAGHERGHFLVPNLHELQIVLTALNGAENTVDAVAGITEYSSYTPFQQAGNHKIANRLRRHLQSPAAVQKKRNKFAACSVPFSDLFNEITEIKNDGTMDSNPRMAELSHYLLWHAALFILEKVGSM
jgi:hypothetical protein